MPRPLGWGIRVVWWEVSCFLFPLALQLSIDPITYHFNSECVGVIFCSWWKLFVPEVTWLPTLVIIFKLLQLSSSHIIKLWQRNSYEDTRVCSLEELEIAQDIKVQQAYTFHTIDFVIMWATWGFWYEYVRACVHTQVTLFLRIASRLSVWSFWNNYVCM